jgi:hypothetical protein
MESAFRYRGRVITAAEVEFIRQLIAAPAGANRRQLSLQLCEAWQWKQANGAPRDMVCRGLLLGLERAGQIELPPVLHVHRNPPARRGAKSSPAVPVQLDITPVHGPLSQWRPLEFRQVRRTPEETLFNNLLKREFSVGLRRRWFSKPWGLTRLQVFAHQRWRGASPRLTSSTENASGLNSPPTQSNRSACSSWVGSRIASKRL